MKPGQVSLVICLVLVPRVAQSQPAVSADRERMYQRYLELPFAGQGRQRRPALDG